MHISKFLLNFSVFFLLQFVASECFAQASLGAESGFVEDFQHGVQHGQSSGVSFTNSPSGQAVFKRENESRIVYPYSGGFPREGTIEFTIKVDSAYRYRAYKLEENMDHALIFTTDVSGGDVTWPGSAWLQVYKNGDISFTIARLKGVATSKTPDIILKAAKTDFQFGKWHNLGVSFGNQGRYIRLDGKIVASDSSQTQSLAGGGTRRASLGQPTIGESISHFWKENQYDGGFEGQVDKFRVSKNQQDWKISKTSLVGGQSQLDNASISSSAIPSFDISGIWEGVGKQSSGSQWTIRMKFENGDYKIDYPSLSCGGHLEFLSRSGNEYTFREKITRNTSRCVNNGKLVVRQIGSDNLDWKWYYSSGRLGATSVVTRNLDDGSHTSVAPKQLETIHENSVPNVSLSPLETPTIRPMTEGEINSYFSGNTVLFKNGEVEYLKNDGTTVYESLGRGLILGTNWAVKPGEICFEYAHQASENCVDVIWNNGEINWDNKSVEIKDGDSNHLEAKYVKIQQFKDVIMINSELKAGDKKIDTLELTPIIGLISTGFQNGAVDHNIIVKIDPNELADLGVSETDELEVSIRDGVTTDMQTTVKLLFSVTTVQTSDYYKTKRVTLSAKNGWQTRYNSKHRIITGGDVDWLVMKSQMKLVGLQNEAFLTGVTVK